MSVNISRALLFVLICFCIPFKAISGTSQSEEHVLVSLRMIGHEVLLASGDSSSRVMPIKKVGERYKISFSSDFSFQPEALRYITDSLIKESQIASAYILEVEDCDSGNVVYSYEISEVLPEDFMACIGRPQEVGCYNIFLRIISPINPLQAYNDLASENNVTQKKGGVFSTDSLEIIFFILIGFVLCLILLIRVRKRSNKKSSHIISIGSFHFDHKNMSLFKGNEKQDLTGKETHLLQLLYKHLNSTVDRDVILREVWKDEGDYIGRTLDVYISKLRKKFETDPSVSIINVRGVGYKLTLN